MARRPANDRHFVIEGDFEFRATASDSPPITDRFRLRIQIPRNFPDSLPAVFEIGGRIPPTGSFHVNPDRSLCLGSPLRLRWILSSNPTLRAFAESCVIPYLYAISYRLTNGGNLVFGELPHGHSGELADYVDLFRLKSVSQVRLALKYLGMKKRRANKRPCPCGCSKRLGACHFNQRLREFRALGSRPWFRELLS
jgi:hypothetical protein